MLGGRNRTEGPSVMRVSSLEPARQVLAGLAGRVAGRAGDRAQDAQPAGATPHPVRRALLVTGTVGAVVGAGVGAGVAAWQRRERQVSIDPWVAATAARPGLAPGDGSPPPAPGTPEQDVS